MLPTLSHAPVVLFLFGSYVLVCLVKLNKTTLEWCHFLQQFVLNSSLEFFPIVFSSNFKIVWLDSSEMWSLNDGVNNVICVRSS